MAVRKLDELLLAEGLLDEQSLSTARTEALARQRKLAEVVIDLGFADQRSLAALLARESGVELISPIDTDAAREIAKAIPLHLARRHQVVPIRSDEGGLLVAMLDPFEPGITELLESSTGTPVRRAVGVRSEIEMAVLDLYGADDAADVTLLVPRTLELELGAHTAAPEGEYSGIPDDWSTSDGEATASAGDTAASDVAKESDADRTAPSTAGAITDSERIAHVERQILNVSRALALIQSRLDTIDARLANLAGQSRVSK